MLFGDIRTEMIKYEMCLLTLTLNHIDHIENILLRTDRSLQ